MTGHELVEQSLLTLDSMVIGFAPKTAEDSIAIASSLLVKAAQLLTTAKDKPYAAAIFYLYADNLIAEKVKQ